MYSEMVAGRYAISWDGRNQVSEVIAASTYLYRLVVHGSNSEGCLVKRRGGRE
ncbi:MAG: hypothetical protein ACREOI_02130 [bacterium]